MPIDFVCIMKILQYWLVGTVLVPKWPCFVINFIAYPHVLVRATNEQFLPAMATFRVGLASESHWI